MSTTPQPFTRLPTSDPVANDLYDKVAVALKTAQQASAAAAATPAASASASTPTTTPTTSAGSAIIPSLTALPSVNPSSSPYAVDGQLISVSTGPTVPGTLYRYTAKTMQWIKAIAVSQSTTLAYAEITASVSITATTSGTANTIVTAASLTFDGTASIYVEFFSPECDVAAATVLDLELYDNGLPIGTIGRTNLSIGPQFCRRKLTPSSGAHIYSIRGWKAGGSVNIVAGAGGSGVILPAYIAVLPA